MQARDRAQDRRIIGLAFAIFHDARLIALSYTVIDIIPDRLALTLARHTMRLYPAPGRGRN